MTESQTTEIAVLPFLLASDLRDYYDQPLVFQCYIPCVVQACVRLAHCQAGDVPRYLMCEECFWEDILS